MEQYTKDIKMLLRRLGVNSSYVGYEFVVYGVIWTITDSELLTYICKGLYVEIAIQFHTTVKCVERNIRTVINRIWEYGNRELLNEIFGKELYRKPKNAEFVDALVNYIVEDRIS